jgi:hypothetical protein
MDKLLNEISHDQYLFRVDNFMQSAWLGHAPFLKYLIREQKPSVFVELGVHNGFSYFTACQAIQECGLNTKSFAIDHWFGDEQAGFFDESIYDSVKTLNKKYEGFSKLIKKNFFDALADFKGIEIDLLHIDGFHSYESVKADFDSWLPLMSENGIVLLHDVHVRRNSFGVYKFWHELKSKYITIEFVGSHGLGVLFLGDVPEGGLKEIVQLSNDGNLSQIQGTFGSISDDVIQNSRTYEFKLGLAERDNAVAERDNAVAERDNAVAERDNAVAERDMLLSSKIWKITKPYRWIRRKF